MAPPLRVPLDGSGTGGQPPKVGPRLFLQPAPGHLAAFVGLWLFTLVLYLRPNDLLPIGTFPVAKIIGFGTLCAFFTEQLTHRRPFTVTPPELKYLLALMAFMLLSIPLAIDPGRAFDGFSDEFLKAFLIFVLIINVVNSFQRLRRLLALTTVCGTIIAAASLREFVAGAKLDEGYRATGFVGGLFGNPNDLSLALTMFIPLAVGLALTAGHLSAKLFHWTSVLCMIAVVVATYSRGGFLALSAVGAYLTTRLGRRYRVLVALAVIAFVLTSILASAGYGARVLSIFGDSADPGTIESRENRMALISRSFEAVGLNPKAWLLGVGMENFPIVSIHEAVNHNAYLQVFTEVGVPALILYVMFIVSVLKGTGRIAKAFRGRRDREAVAVIAVAIQGSLIAYAVGSFFASVAYLWYLYYAAGFAVALELLADAVHKQKGSRR